MDPEENFSSTKGSELAWERLAHSSKLASQNPKALL